MKDIDREIRRFLWQGGKIGSIKKNHLINWEIVCKPKIYGGAGVRDTMKMNLALGSKNLWRVVTGKDAWQKKFCKKNTCPAAERDA